MRASVTNLTQQLPLPPTVAIVISFVVPGPPKGKGRPRAPDRRPHRHLHTPGHPQRRSRHPLFRTEGNERPPAAGEMRARR